MIETTSHTSTDGWAGQVAFSGGADGFAYVPDEVVVGGRAGVDVAARLYKDRLAAPEPIFSERREDEPGQLYRVRLADDLDPVTVVQELRIEGVTAQPNHVVFAHGECCCGAHPAHRWHAAIQGTPLYASPLYASPLYASPLYASPLYASPLYASPLYASPLYASPLYASPLYASEFQSNGRRRSSARPATAPTLPHRQALSGARRPRVAVLDTGLARDGLRPNALDTVAHPSTGWEEGPDDDSDNHLDPAAGHGTFIAGLIELLAPGCDITVVRVLTNYGEGNEVAIAQHIEALAGVDLLNLSFGGYAMERMDVLHAAIRTVQRAGTVVVASAGNDATCRPALPAALPDVVSVGALGPAGPAPFTNYGPWVRSCAPGVDLVSYFFTQFDGAEPATAGGVDPDNFATWAAWSGSSFAAPVVVAALAREMQLYNLPAGQAVERIIDAPGLFRMPDLGTVVNLQ